MDRAEKILAEIDRGMRILELGPSFSPIAPKSAGWNSIVVDHASKDELVEKYRPDHSVDVSRIEDVDVVWEGEPLHEALPAAWLGTFDAFIASHVLEHIPDPIGLLQSLESILKPSGVVSLVIPDKRFCFDFFKPLSTTGGLLAAHERGATRHAHQTYSTTSPTSSGTPDCSAGGDSPSRTSSSFHSLADAKLQLETYGSSEDDPYATPRLAFHTVELPAGHARARSARSDRLHDRPHVPYGGLRVLRDSPEGSATSRRSRPAQAARLDLLRRTFAEVGEQIDLLTGDSTARRRPWKPASNTS